VSEWGNMSSRGLFQGASTMKIKLSVVV